MLDTKNIQILRCDTNVSAKLKKIEINRYFYDFEWKVDIHGNFGTRFYLMVDEILRRNVV